MEHGLPPAGPDVDDHAVVVEALRSGNLRHEAQHPARFLVRECGDLAERVDMALGQHEEVRLGRRRDVA